MALTAITNASEIKRAFSKLSRRLRTASRPLRRVVGWPGGSAELIVRWNPGTHCWSYLSPDFTLGRYWCAYGTQDPTESKTLSITCEINPPRSGVNRRCGGLFVRDSRGRVYLAHSGKVGGGGTGVGKAAFTAWYGHGNWQDVEWPDGNTTRMIIIGRVEGLGKDLPWQVAEYARHVDDFKNHRAPANGDSEIIAKKLSFTPEFSGSRRAYRIAGEVESECYHGSVVEALHDRLEGKGFRAHNYRNGVIDLYVTKKGGAISHLFEIKTDCSTTSVYQAVGQVMLHGAKQEPAPRRVLVLPDPPTGQTRGALKRLGISVITYRWVDRTPCFKGIDQVMRA